MGAAILILAGCTAKKMLTKKPVNNADTAASTTLLIPEQKDATKSAGVCDEASMPQRIFFEFDSYRLEEKARNNLKNLGKLMLGCPRIKIVIGGHCDERGSAEYNLALGQKRADFARNYLLNLGIDSNRIRTMSFGEEMPLMSGSGEKERSKNRRDELAIDG